MWSRRAASHPAARGPCHGDLRHDPTLASLLYPLLLVQCGASLSPFSVLAYVATVLPGCPRVAGLRSRTMLLRRRLGSVGSYRVRSMIRVVMYSPLRLYEGALARVLDAQPEIQVVGTSAGEPDLGKLVRQTKADVVVADLAAPESYLTIEDLVGGSSGIKVVAVCVPETEHHVVQCFRMGVSNIVVQSGSVEELIGAVRGAARGEVMLRPQIAALLSRILAGLGTGRDYGPRGVSLTPRERQIVGLIDQGLSNEEIGGLLGIKVSTVKNHVHNILEKLHVRRRGQAVAVVRGRATGQLSGSERPSGSSRS